MTTLGESRDLPGLDRTLMSQFVLGASLWLYIARWQGYDLSWDVLNYHFYNGFALLHGRVFTNLDVSMLQSYYSPLMDAAFYVLVRLLPPALVLFTIALFQSLVFPILFQLSRLLLVGFVSAGWQLNIIALVLTLLGAGAPVNILEAGGALGDTVSAVFVLLALLIMTDVTVRLRRVPSPGRAAIAGALVGFAAGLKLTNVAFALGLLAAIVVALFGLRGAGGRRASGMVLAAGLGGMGVAFLLTYGWWGLLLFQHFGNPAFPNFNQFFRSPYAAPASYADPAFLLPTWQQKLLFPFVRTSIFGRDPAGLFDLRMAVALPLSLLGLIAALARIRSAKREATGGCAAPALMAFLLVSYLGWLLVFPINRYLVAADMLAPLACVVAALSLWRVRRVAWAVAAVMTVVLPTSAATSWSVWWLPANRSHGSAGGYFGVGFTPPPGLDGSVVAMMSDEPIAFVIPYFPRDTRFVRLQGSLWYWNTGFYQLSAGSSAAARRAVFGNEMGAAICQRLDAHKSSLFLLRPGPATAHDQAAMRYFGVEPAPGDCTAIANKANMPLQLCPAQRAPDPECDTHRS